ncbi:ankyrin repeat-containing domain protein [Colletotrichum phormii]|uniref:Ankyrin repeat-containing domain protein n=1 Tax=Colletotrichum phormii TaxID=359342 RepID=A0AAI9ZEK8_9PEZI|nr:ankyrin repeat-containing domain protein [Colletotrichum phormii]KAK1622056.1 ankyrin repeat-containing domain protein [Colletotrichum phormii]
MYDPNTKESGDNKDKNGLLKYGRTSAPDSDADDFQPGKKRKTGVDRPGGDAPVVEDYTVGWVCALPLEMAAAKGMLDQLHPNLPWQDPADHNSYVLGQVQGHNVVIACLPAGIYGITPAATVAKDLLRTFKSIRFGLMVGIGGGVPSRKHDIRLGDIVVSQPAETSGGVIQYDRGKTVQEGEFQRTGSLNAPPQVLLAALGRLQADHMIEDSRVPQFISELISKSPKIIKKKFSHQGALYDCLFQAEYDHVDSDSTCDECDPKQKIQREDRDDTNPVIHYGNIASGNQVIKHGKTRDKLSKDLGVLCFEMEAAGLQDFPCLVIRGVCDYADSHKNNRWHEYAAITAAAFAKELLSVIPPNRVLQEKLIPQLVSDPDLHRLVSNTNTAISAQTQKQEVRYESQKQVDCHQTFKTSAYEKFKNINPDRVPGTCKWVLEHPRYQTWQQSRHDDLLWISADPGCGKSVLAKSLIDGELQSTNHHIACYFFFKDNDDQNNLATALCALLHQLFNFQPFLIRHAIAAFEKNGEKLQTEVDELWRIFIATTTDDQAINVTCVLDALDECCIDDRRKIIQFLTNFHKRQTTSTRKSQLKFLVTSRPYQDIESEFRNIPEPQTIRLAGEEKNADISEEINLVVHDTVLKAGREYQLDQDMQGILRTKLLGTPNRTYLWLHLMIKELPYLDKITKRAFQKDIDSLPQSVEQAYERILSRHSNGHRKKVQTLLHIVVGARQPLTLIELYVAYQLATELPNADRHDDLELDHIHFKLRIRDLCGLFVFINDNRVYLIHQTAKEFLVQRIIHPSPANNRWKHSLYKPHSDAIMTQICVQYLSFRDIQDNRFPAGRRETDTSTTQYPFLEYSATHWPSHLRDANPPKDVLQKQILQLYNMQDGRFETWVSIFWQTNYQYKARGGLNNVNAGDGFDGNALYIASFRGHDKIVQMLLNKGADVNAQGGDYGNALQAGSLEGHDKIVQMLLNKGADVNAQGGDYGNALQAGSLEGHDKIVQMLLNKGADVNAQGGEYGNALQAASYEGYHNIVQMLLDKGADVNAEGGEYDNALYIASFRGHDKIVQMLFNKGADVNAEGGDYGNALQAASYEGYHNIVQMLLDKGADVNAEGGYYDNALYIASFRGHDKIVQMLLNKGADVNAEGGYYDNALYIASFRGHDKIVQMLLNKCADVNAQGGEYGNALQAASYEGYHNIVQMLLNKGADVNAQGGRYGNALQAASLEGHDKIVQMLLNKGADVNAQGGEYGNALQAASYEGYHNIVQMLLDKGADVNAEGGEYDNTLYIASFKGHDKIVQMLLNKGADAASSGGHDNIVQMLLDKGADVNAQGGRYGNALQAASSGGHDNIVQMLLDKGADVNAEGGRYGNALQAASEGGYENIVQMLLWQCSLGCIIPSL